MRAIKKNMKEKKIFPLRNEKREKSFLFIKGFEIIKKK